jgi:hypothetical protein
MELEASRHGLAHLRDVVKRRRSIPWNGVFGVIFIVLGLYVGGSESADRAIMFWAQVFLIGGAFLFVSAVIRAFIGDVDG